MTIEDKRKAPDSSHLFTIRVWVGSGYPETKLVRIEVKHVLSGANRTFLGWSEAIEFIEAQLVESGPNQAWMEG